MSVRIEVYADDELQDSVEYETRVEAEADGVGKVILDMIPITDEDLENMTTEEKKAHLDRLMEELGEEG